MKTLKYIHKTPMTTGFLRPLSLLPFHLMPEESFTELSKATYKASLVVDTAKH